MCFPREMINSGCWAGFFIGEFSGENSSEVSDKARLFLGGLTCGKYRQAVWLVFLAEADQQKPLARIQWTMLNNVLTNGQSSTVTYPILSLKYVISGF